MKALLNISILTLATQSWAGFDVNQNIGSERIQFTSPNNVQEICVIPQHLNINDKVNYSKSDLKKEKTLCHVDFYSNQSVICPKYSSTSAATNIYVGDSDQTKSFFQNATQCFNLGKTKPSLVKGFELPDKAGKFKQNEPKNTTTGTYIASPLAYYHISRALGGILNIPVAVVRTMDVEEHKKEAQLFSAIKSNFKVSPGTTLGWSAFAEMHSGNRSDARLYTKDQKQIYGAFVKGGGSSKAYELDTDATLNKQQFYKLTVDTMLIQDNLASANAQTKREQVLLAKDLSDMVIIDTILEQGDRYSGQNIEKYTTYFDGQKYISEKDYQKIKLENPKLIYPAIKRLTIQDNDAGLKSPKNISNLQRLAKIKHVSPLTYSQLQALAKYENLKSFLISETLLSENEATRVINTIASISSQLKTACLDGSLKVDLDVDNVLNNTATESYSKSNCEK